MANTYTTETVLQRVKLGVNDNGATPVWLTDVLYNTFIANAVVSENQTYRFTLYGTGLWKLDGGPWGGNPYVLHCATPAAPFTGNGTTATYNTSCWGSIITTATDTTPYYEVTGCKVDYAAIMCELNMWLAQHRALQIASQNGQDVGVTAKYLIDTANRWAGISGGAAYFGGTR